MRSLSSQHLRGLALSICIIYAIIGISLFALHGNPSRAAMENKRFIASSPSWLDRQACRWFGICGAMNWLRSYRKAPQSPAIPDEKQSELRDHPPHDFTDAWIDPAADPDSWNKSERRLRRIPNFVLEYAPLVHLFGHEKFWPSDLAEHLEHTYAKFDNDTIPDFKLNLWNLADLNEYDGGRKVFLTSKDDPESEPDWLLSPHNIPGVPGSDPDRPTESTPGRRKGRKNVKSQARREGWGRIDRKYNAHEEEVAPIEGDVDSEGEEPAFEVKLPNLHISDPDSQRVLRNRRRSGSTATSNGAQETGPGLRSNAPAFLICIDKGEGIVDAFWFYFYSFNEGNSVFGITFGNHVGDWEHTMVRFQNGEPKAVYLSRHAWGSIYTYDALEKIGKRPVVYAGDGSHAHYPTAGRQNYILPLGLLHDTTSKGPLWDPVQNLKSYTYDPESDNLRASLLNPKAPTSWFHFAGRWGDKHYDLSDHRQYRFLGEYHYGNGPSGPKFKHLKRETICEHDKCNIQDYID